MYIIFIVYVFREKTKDNKEYLKYHQAVPEGRLNNLKFSKC